MSDDIFLNDILKIKNIDDVKIRFIKSWTDENREIINPLEYFKNDKERLLRSLFWNYKKKKSFKEGEVVLGFVRMYSDKWLFFNASKITKDLFRI
ncbi:hypothetical protein MASR1M90_24030 [Desulfovibrionales bacterium]